MRIKGIVVEDFLQYKCPSMFIITSLCDFKCERDCGIKGICQNSSLANAPTLNVDEKRLIQAYVENNITKAVVFGGLEPMLQIDDVLSFLSKFRLQNDDPVIIYTGYTEAEVQSEVQKLSQFPNIIVKFGRFVPNQKPHFDPVLGVELASDNQYAVKIS